MLAKCQPWGFAFQVYLSLAIYGSLKGGCKYVALRISGGYGQALDFLIP